MPPSLSERTWASFANGGTTLGPTPGLRARWHAGRSRYAVWMVRLDGPVVRERAAQLQRALAPWIRPVPLDDLHITLRVAGFLSPRPHPDAAFPAVDHVDPGALRATLERIPARPARVQVGRANSFTSAAFLEVGDPAGDLARLRRSVLHVGADEARRRPWLPHLTVGTWLRTGPNGQAARCLQRHRCWRPISPQQSRAGLAIIDPESSAIRSFEAGSLF